MKLSIIIPVYNEEKTIAQTLKRVNDAKFKNIDTEIIVIDDGSTDTSKSKIESVKISGLRFFIHAKNQGKGAAVRTGIEKATGDYIVIQDADLEYNPNEIPELIKPVLAGKAEVVYGTRLKRPPNFSRDERTARFFIHYVGNKFLSLMTSTLYGVWVTDMETCYKLFPKKALKGIKLRARGFELEPEITAKLLKKGYKIYEVPISTNPRGYAEGKKIHTIRDGLKALWALTRYRFSD